MKALAVCVLVACSPPPRPKPPPERDAPDSKPVAPRPGKQYPAPPTGFATADLVTIVGGELATYAIVNDKLQKTGTVTLVHVTKEDASEPYVTGIGHGNWADHDHLFLTVGARDVVMVTASAIVEVPIPSVEVFKTKKPPAIEGHEYDAGDPTGTGDINHTGLVVTDGEAWWAACPWGLGVDGFQCNSYVNARLWPTALVKVDARALQPMQLLWSSRIPTGFKTTTDKDRRTVECERAGKKESIAAAPDDGTEEIVDVHWVSVAPARMLVIFGHPGMSGIIEDRWTLHDGCTAKPIATGAFTSPGGDGVWIGAMGEGPTTRRAVYRGAVHVGDLPGLTRVYLRPAK